MKYALSLNEENRILSATEDRFGAEGQPRVEKLPDGDISDYKYINNDYVYDPLPKPDPAIEEEKAKQALLREMKIDEILNNGTGTATINQDVIACDTYTLISKTNNEINPEPYCQVFARRVQRDEIKIKDVPSELKTRVQEIIGDNPQAALQASITNGTINGQESISGNLEKNSSLTFAILAKDGYRVPTIEEVASKINFVAKDNDGNILDNYFQSYCSYNTTNLDSASVLRISVTEEVASITLNIECISRMPGRKKKKK